MKSVLLVDSRGDGEHKAVSLAEVSNIFATQDNLFPIGWHHLTEYITTFGQFIMADKSATQSFCLTKYTNYNLLARRKGIYGL